MNWLGDFPEDFTTVTCMFTTHASTGAPVAPSTAFENADVIIYKNGSATQKTSQNGVTMTSPFDSITGLHCLSIDTSNDTGDGGFWVAGAVYTLVLSPDTETVDSLAVAKVIGQFGIGLAAPEVANRVWQEDVSTGYTGNQAGAVLFANFDLLDSGSFADALLDRAAGVETGLTVRQAMRLIASALFGKGSGLASTTAKYRDFGDTKDRIVATVDADGNRSAVTTDAT